MNPDPTTAALIEAVRRALEAMARWGLDAAETTVYVRLMKAAHNAELEQARKRGER